MDTALVNRLRQAHPTLRFIAGRQASWSPAARQVTYCDTAGSAAVWSLLHELGHALLNHTSYQSDLQLLQKETSAWAKAKAVARELAIEIDDAHIQGCLDTYRDWLHKRSTCPECGDHGLQPSQSLYRCLNCQTAWQVSAERFCRPYRLKSGLSTH